MEALVIVDSKICSKCKDDKPFGEFYKKSSAKDGWQPKCKTCVSEYVKSDAGKQSNAKYAKSDKGKQALAKYAKTNKGKESNRRGQAKHAKTDKGKQNQAKNDKKWRKDNLGRVNAAGARYRATKKNQTPPWACLETIKQFYIACPKGYHIDHIIPISKGGYHTMENLQYLTAFENMSKSDSWDYSKELKEYSGL